MNCNNLNRMFIIKEKMQHNHHDVYILHVFSRVPHWSVFCSGAWLGLTRWRKPCCSPRAHTRTVSRRCASADESSGSPDASTLYYSLRTDAHGHKHLYSVVFKRAQTEAVEQRRNSQCTCEVSRRCVCACGPPACTAPWRASAPESSPSSDTRTPSSPRGCVRYWCAETQTQQFSFALRVSLSPPFVMSASRLSSNWPCRALKTRRDWLKIKQFELLRRTCKAIHHERLSSPRLSDGNKEMWWCVIVRECVFKSVSGDGQEPSDLSQTQIHNYEQTLRALEWLLRDSWKCTLWICDWLDLCVWFTPQDHFSSLTLKPQLLKTLNQLVFPSKRITRESSLDSSLPFYEFMFIADS